jgi:hypothetical protein
MTMRDDRSGTGAIRRLAPIGLAGVLLSWLVVQNGVLLLMVSWPVMPTLMTIARALLKAGSVLAVQMAPATLVVGGVVLLWMAARRAAPTAGRLGDARRV